MILMAKYPDLMVKLIILLNWRVLIHHTTGHRPSSALHLHHAFDTQDTPSFSIPSAGLSSTWWWLSLKKYPTLPMLANLDLVPVTISRANVILLLLDNFMPMSFQSDYSMARGAVTRVETTGWQYSNKYSNQKGGKILGSLSISWMNSVLCYKRYSMGRKDEWNRETENPSMFLRTTPT